MDAAVFKDFVEESERLLKSLLVILTAVKGRMTRAPQLEDYANQVDRIMGAAKSLALDASPNHSLHLISELTDLCKSVAYKVAKIDKNPQFFDLSVTILTETTITLQYIFAMNHLPVEQIQSAHPQALGERLHWLAKQFRDSQSGGAPSKDKLTQTEIDEMMKKLSGR